MFGIGLPELIIILVVALLVVGPSKLPEVARSIGKAFGDFRRMADEVKETFVQDLDQEEGNRAESKEVARTPAETENLPGESKQEGAALKDGETETVEADSATEQKKA